MDKPSAIESAARREDELLQCLCRVSPGQATMARIGQLVREPLDWPLVFKRSWWHRIRPLAYKHLSAQPAGLVPDEILSQLADAAAELRERNQNLLNELLGVAATFEEAQLRLLAFKGPALAADAYGDLSLRECGDLDVLVHREDFESAAALLEAQGFERVESEDTTAQGYECEFKRDLVRLDVHWDLAPGWFNYQVDFDELWNAGIPLTTQSHFARKVCPEDSMVVLSIHGAKHWWERLRWIGDIAELIESGQVKDWKRVELGAEKARGLRSVYLGLWLATELLGARLPDEIQQKLDSQKWLGKLGTQVECWLAHGKKAQRVRKLKERFWFRMGLCERWRDRIPQIMCYLRERPTVDAG